MPDPERSSLNDVDHLLINAELRNELEPFQDESMDILDVRHLPTPEENEFLASLLAWEKAPVLPISQWFEPELVLPPPETLNDQQLTTTLWATIRKLYKQRIVLDFTDHLSDRELYALIFRDILSSPEKKVDLPKNYLHWHCINEEDDVDLWLRYYASDEEREQWADESGSQPPRHESPPYPRKLPPR